MGQVHVAALGKCSFLDNHYPFPDNPCPVGFVFASGDTSSAPVKHP